MNHLSISPNKEYPHIYEVELNNLAERITFYVGKWKYYHKTFVIPKKKLFMTHL